MVDGTTPTPKASSSTTKATGPWAGSDGAAEADRGQGRRRSLGPGIRLSTLNFFNDTMRERCAGAAAARERVE